MFKHIVSAFLVAAMLVGGKFAMAQDAPSLQDKDFVTKAASAGKLEVELGKYATDHSANDDVKQFGRQMSDDHTKANDQLKALASGKNIDVRSSLGDEDQAELDRLEKLSGADFDKAYADQMVKDHQAAIELFTNEKDQGTDHGLKDFATQTLPTLQHHLEMAQDLNRKVNPQ